MERLDHDENAELIEGRRNVARICVFLGISCVLMLILRFQTNEIETSKQLDSSMERLKLKWERFPLVSSDTSLLTVSYLDVTNDHAISFYSNRATKERTSMLAASSGIESIWEDPSWISDVFSNISEFSLKSAPFPEVDQLLRVRKTGSSAIISVTFVSRFRVKKFKDALPGCFDSSEKNESDRCYIALRANPLNECMTPEDGTAAAGAVDISWSCLTPRKNDKCVELVSANTLSGFRKTELRGKLKFCGNPLQQLIALDSFAGRVFFVQDANNYHEKCISTLYLEDYKDITPCMDLAKIRVNNSFIHLDSPVYLQYDHLSRSLIVIRFDSTPSLVATVLDTSRRSLAAKYSLRYKNLVSAWLVSSEDPDQSQVIILGNKTPYAGTVHAINLTDAFDTRVALKDKYLNQF